MKIGYLKGTPDFRKLEKEMDAFMKDTQGAQFSNDKVDMSTAAKEWAKDERAEGKVEGGFSELVDLVIDGDLSLGEAVSRAGKYGVKDEEDFRKRALLLGKKI